ncbi:hypothetical protein CAEBREN_23207 [Caenorhabditis brenneri]|uniref:Uncharacterized protein n=1 Tax=Caenorhabditis brenneri TaxID=135651 RepID=G0NUY2_CAEBE|nr:hypothetical protein CAEBREN_23207 [Caenorhabditis brenneri]
MSKAADIALICACCFGLPVFIALTVVLLVLPIYLLIVGIVEMDSCPIDPRIPPLDACDVLLNDY